MINGLNYSLLCAELAQAVVDAGAVPLLVLCIQEPEISVKRISASALSDICKHSPEVCYQTPNWQLQSGCGMIS